MIDSVMRPTRNLKRRVGIGTESADDREQNLRTIVELLFTQLLEALGHSFPASRSGFASERRQAPGSDSAAQL